WASTPTAGCRRPGRTRWPSATCGSGACPEAGPAAWSVLDQAGPAERRSHLVVDRALLLALAAALIATLAAAGAAALAAALSLAAAGAAALPAAGPTALIATLAAAG